MNISDNEKQELEKIYQSFLKDERIQIMKSIPMHNGSNCYIHSFKVAKLAMKRALRHKRVNLKTLLIASILHDYYLYDWRKEKERKKKHGSKHPFIASSNAAKDFSIDEEAQRVMESHMWPINFKHFPKTKEARILTFADKTIATREFLTSKRHKQKKNEQYMTYISHLF